MDSGQINERRGWDSNPRSPEGNRFSKPAPYQARQPRLASCTCSFAYLNSLFVACCGVRRSSLRDLFDASRLPMPSSCISGAALVVLASQVKGLSRNLPERQAVGNMTSYPWRDRPRLLGTLLLHIQLSSFTSFSVHIPLPYSPTTEDHDILVLQYYLHS